MIGETFVRLNSRK